MPSSPSSLNSYLHPRYNFGMAYEPIIESPTLECEALPPAFDGLTILHLSDLHVTRWTPRLSLWQTTLAKLKPDLVAITGDLGHRSWMWKTSLPTLTRLLEPLTPPMGTYFILGNHDSLKLGPALEAGGRVLLENESIIFTNKGESPKEKGKSSETLSPESFNLSSPSPRLALIGLHQHRRIDTDILAALANVRPSDFKLFLLHYPDLITPARAAGADIVLAGHTHGGQICWPDGSPLIRHDSLPHAMCTGIHQVGKTWLVVNRGIGVAGIRMRLFCPPHAILLTLKCQSVNQ